jgi:CRP-like cAMP-binding protein
VKLTTTRSVLATELGTRRETLSRLLARLRESGAIRIDGRKFEIPDPDVLRERLEGRRNCP